MEIVGHVSGKALLEGLSAVEEIVSLGIGVEVQLTSELLDTFTYKEFGILKDKVRGRALTVHAPFLDLNPGAFDSYVLDATRQRFLEAVSVAKVLEAKVIVFHTGFHPLKVAPYYQVWFKRAIETFKMVAEEFDGKIALENVFDTNPENLKKFLKELPPKVGVCIDTGHLNLFSEVPLSEWIGTFKDRIYEFHLHDNYGKKDEHAPLDSGNFNFEELFNLLEIVNSEYIFNLENKAVSDVRESLDALRRFKWKGKLESTPMRS
ncbi:sugar phosphate isomerase/epimerase [Thermovibrio guaymasensis]|uniref:Sugar phosphate isomerase/epimerase n=1 Tax=Thermovibrio guaymasensis TaxID=240167 RepID=A0A420W9A4_9BACT|nr:sugar phosphate isomerase/epimerase family protein [Thermovibrio guaymasensis]RKQ63911.1 sugar phosphate isomerase/epimerase [Thermovibrio guaymasensis]